MAKDDSPSDHFNLARLGLLAGALGLFGSTAYMNISGWVAQAEDVPQAIANGSMAAGFELMALCGLAWAGLQWARKRRGAAVVTGAIAAAAIIFNTFAAENFLHLQAGELANMIETSAQIAQVTQAQIDALSAELQGIVDNNDGRIPRPVEAIEGYYSRFDPESNPINMSRKDAEIALREEYERVQSEIAAARQAMISDSVRANDDAHTVIPTAMLGPFVWVLEIIKGTILFALGTHEARNPRSPDAADRQKWAIIRAKQRANQLNR